MFTQQFLEEGFRGGNIISGHFTQCQYLLWQVNNVICSGSYLSWYVYWYISSFVFGIWLCTSCPSRHWAHPCPLSPSFCPKICSHLYLSLNEILNGIPCPWGTSILRFDGNKNYPYKRVIVVNQVINCFLQWDILIIFTRRNVLEKTASSATGKAAPAFLLHQL